MSVKVKISYEKPQELCAVLELLRPMMKSYKAEKGGNGPYKMCIRDRTTSTGCPKASA